MKVYLELPQRSRGLQRVYDALVLSAPEGVLITSHRSEADIVVLHVIGRNDQVRLAAERATAGGQQYVVIQYAFRSTMRPSASAWIDIWQGAKFVWSYYDLPQECAVDNESTRFEFYDAPLGCDATMFKPLPSRDIGEGHRIYTAGVISQSWLTEGTREVVEAANVIGGSCWHAGASLGRSDVISYVDISDETLRQRYANTRFVPCLRRVEGFEQPAVEALLCGARPILFDRAHYRRWFDGHAHFIPEGSREQVVQSLVDIFGGPRWEVDPEERRQIADKFSWPKITAGFWERALA